MKRSILIALAVVALVPAVGRNAGAQTAARD
jgi:hypothetical protein